MRLSSPPRYLASTAAIACVLLAVACGQEAANLTRPTFDGRVAPSFTDIPRPPGYDGTLWLCKVGPSSEMGVVYSLRVTVTGGAFQYATGSDVVDLTVFDGEGPCQAGAGGPALYYPHDGSTLHVSVEEILPTPNGSTPQSWTLVWDNATQDVISTGGAVNPFVFDLNTSATFKGIMFDQKLTLTNGEAPPPPPSGKGCTPGYWKVSQHWDSWPAPYVPSASIQTYFPQASLYGLGSNTLVEGLGFGGGSGAVGGARILLRAGIAGLLNSSAGFSGSYPMTTSQLLDAVNAALASGDRDAMISLGATIDGNNNLGCPLN